MLLALLAMAALGSAPIQPVAFLEPLVPQGQPGGGFVAWRQAPTLDEFYAAYPDGEQGRGSVNLDCAVAADGAPEDCRITAQAPASPAFAAAALAFVRRLRMADSHLAVARARGARVMIALAFVRRGEDRGPVPADRCIPPLCSFIPAAPPPPATPR